MKNVIFFLILFSFSIFAQNEDDKKTFEEKEQEIIDYSSIQKTLQADGLTQQKNVKKAAAKNIKKARIKIDEKKYYYPSNDDFWFFMSELWLVKNAQILNWDFPKPQYGIDKAFKGLLEKLGYYNKSFKILVINSPTIVHYGLPSKKDEYIFILSLPFMKSLDLTKVNLALILLEDFLRLEKGYFLSNLSEKTDFLGQSFQSKKFATEKIDNIQKKYSELIFKKGFNFQQQFEVTKDMDQILKSDPNLWNAYFNTIQKINGFIKTDVLYKNYLKIYPSPELQLKWLSPKKKVL